MADRVEVKRGCGSLCYQYTNIPIIQSFLSPIIITWREEIGHSIFTAITHPILFAMMMSEIIFQLGVIEY